MLNHVTPTLQTMDWILPIIPAIVFILLMSILAEPARQHFNAILVAGAGSAYLTGGLGWLEFVFIALATAAAYRGLTSYRFIGIAWILHASWDLVHHFYATPIWPWFPPSSAGCAVFDLVIAAWFLCGAPPISPFYGWFRRAAKGQQAT